MRLAGGSTVWEGRVEVLVNNTWGVLSGALTDTGATILCTQLGGGKGIVAPKGAFPEAGTGYLHYIAWFNCTNSHTDLLSCTNVASMTTSAQQVGVVCDVPQGKLNMPCTDAKGSRVRSLHWVKQPVTLYLDGLHALLSAACAGVNLCAVY